MVFIKCFRPLTLKLDYTLLQVFGANHSAFQNILTVFSFIHIYIIGHYNPSVRIIDLVSHGILIHRTKNLYKTIDCFRGY